MSVSVVVFHVALCDEPLHFSFAILDQFCVVFGALAYRSGKASLRCLYEFDKVDHVRIINSFKLSQRLFQRQSVSEQHLICAL